MVSLGCQQFEKFLVIVGNFFDATLRYCKVWRFIEMGVVFSYNMNHGTTGNFVLS